MKRICFAIAVLFSSTGAMAGTHGRINPSGDDVISDSRSAEQLYNDLETLKTKLSQMKVTHNLNRAEKIAGQVLTRLAVPVFVADLIRQLWYNTLTFKKVGQRFLIYSGATLVGSLMHTQGQTNLELTEKGVKELSKLVELKQAELRGEKAAVQIIEE